MNDTYYFINFNERNINNIKFLVISVLDINKLVLINIYKPYSDELFNQLSDLDTFDNISDNLYFDVKRNGKISLDIKL